MVLHVKTYIPLFGQVNIPVCWLYPFPTLVIILSYSILLFAHCEPLLLTETVNAISVVRSVMNKQLSDKP